MLKNAKAKKQANFLEIETISRSSSLEVRKNQGIRVSILYEKDFSLAVEKVRCISRKEEKERQKDQPGQPFKSPAS